VCRLLRDAQLFETKLNQIDGFGDTGKRIIDIVKNKSIPVKHADASARPSQDSVRTANGTGSTTSSIAPKEEAAQR